MPSTLDTVFQPRKMPVQARSTASVDAILEATVQVLLQVGKERLTTRRVAARAGVSIGSLYQYFPNKSSLLQAALRRHMEGVVAAVERVSREQHGRSLAEMGAALASGLITAKMKEGKTGAGLYAVTADVEGQEISHKMSQMMHRIICDMLLSSHERLKDAALVTTILQGTMAGLSRKLLESAEPEKQFETFRRELVRTVPVWRDNELRFHIVIRAGLAIGMLGADRAMQALAFACIAHEAAHVAHEGHLHRAFPDIYGKTIPCGDRSRQTFLKAMDVWSEYAACRSSAMFRPQATQEFERVFCRALEDSLSACQQRVAAHRADGNAPDIFMDIQQLFGDVFICAGYFLGHLDGLGLDIQRHAPRAITLLEKHPEIADLIDRLQRTLHELWLSEDGWTSIEVFSPIYEIICAMMALRGFVFAKTETEWRIVLCEEDHATLRRRGCPT